jgi:hypothetical protein
MKMNYKKLILPALCGMLVCFVSCKGDDDVIPPPVVDPPTPPVDEVYNDLGFEPHKDGEMFDTYRGLVMAGYQGWFGGPKRDDNGSFGNEQWYHYREGGMFRPGVLQNSIDFWPDMSEYTEKYTPGVDGQQGGDTPSGVFMLPNGEPAQVYSAYDESTVNLHFKWMQEYGLDGVFMQRFVGETVNNPNHSKHFNKVLENAMNASNTYERAICVMYDLGGYEPKAANNTATVLADAQSIMDKYVLNDRSAKQKFYLYHNEKPLIALWGVGFNDGRPYSLTDIEELMNGLKDMGFSILLGVPTYWRELRNDALSDSKLHDLIKAADVIMPWLVGRFGENNYAPEFANSVKNDIIWCEANGVDYAPLCYPGSSDRNMHPNNEINPRNGGSFFWKQIHNSVASGAKMIYVAMFDEIDEGTAIYKCLNAKDVPSNQPATDYWVIYNGNSYSRSTAATKPAVPAGDRSWVRRASEMNITFGGIEDNLPTDHYLWLTEQAKAMLRGEIPLKETLPVRK